MLPRCTHQRELPDSTRPAAMNPVALLDLARRGDKDAFERLAEPCRGEIQLHCYRMLGTIHDAEDLVQDTFVRAWQSIDHFEERASFRSWLYRIATNACLNSLKLRSRMRRYLPESCGPAAEHMPGTQPATDVAWLEPYPDSALENIADSAPQPDTRFESHEFVRLAFVAAIQHLPPRQRAALLLHDVLGWSAEESARLLDASVAAVNGALQRARATLRKRVPPPGVTSSPPTDRQLALIDRYMRCWENMDVDGFVNLLREDAVLSMPPWREWYAGRHRIGDLFLWTARPGGHGPFRLVRTAANRQPAFAFYCRQQGRGWIAHSIQVIDLDGDSIAAMTSFVTPSLFHAFGLPDAMPIQSALSEP